MASPHKVTKMVVDVDLTCSDCYNKVRKVMCKIPEIRDQEYDVEKNKVKISVVSCCPDKIKEKLSRKAGTSIQKIQIINVENPKDAAKPKADAAKPKADHDKPKTAAADVNNHKPPKLEKGDGDGKKPQVANKMMFQPPVHGYPQIMYPPTNANIPVVGYGYGYGYGSYEGSGAAPFPGYGYGMPAYGYNYQNNNNNNMSWSSSSSSSGYNNNNNYYENPPPELEGCSVM